jgi:hypothetical protein
LGFTTGVTVNESEFIDQIDCNFPHRKPMEVLCLIKLGASITPNAAYMVLYEICSVPYIPKLRPYLIQKRIELWEKYSPHPLNKIVVPLAIKIVRNRQISISRCLKYLDQVAQYPKMFNALNIVSSACDDPTGLVDERCHEIVHKWQDI